MAHCFPLLMRNQFSCMCAVALQTVTIRLVGVRSFERKELSHTDWEKPTLNMLGKKVDKYILRKIHKMWKGTHSLLFGGRNAKFISYFTTTKLYFYVFNKSTVLLTCIFDFLNDIYTILFYYLLLINGTFLTEMKG